MKDEGQGPSHAKILAELVELFTKFEIGCQYERGDLYS